MTLATLRTTVLERLGEDASAPIHYTGPMATAALNRALRLFVLRSLCVERSTSFTLTAATCWHHPRDQVTDFLLPLRFEYGGARLRPARLSELDALDATWQASAGSPERYGCLGLNLMAFYKQLAAGGTVTLVYAAAPATLAADADVPEIPAEYHDDLVEGAIPLLRLEEGAQELDKALGGLTRLLNAAAKLGAYVRQRSLDLRYDSVPADLDRYDLSRMLAISRRTAPWLTTSQSRPEAAQT